MKINFYEARMSKDDKVKLVKEKAVNYGSGTVNASPITPRELYIRALLVGAVQIILCHNHPCGSAVPSDEDIGVTNRIRKAGNLAGVKLTGHIIISSDSYFSFKEAERL